MKKTYKVPVSWSVYATMEIKASSLKEALSIAEDAPLPTDPEYLDGSFEINHEIIGCVNNGLSDEDEKECSIISW